MSIAWLKFKQRVFDKGGILTWLIAIAIISLGLLVSNDNPPPVLYLLPVLFGVAFLVILLTNSFTRLLLSIISYATICMIIATCFSIMLGVDPTGVTSTVWLGLIISLVFATLTITYIINYVGNRHFLALNTTVISVILTILSTYLYSGFFETNEQKELALTSIITSFIITIIGLIFYVIINNKAYKLSLSKKKVLGYKFLYNEKTIQEKYEENIINTVTNASKQHKYTMKTFTTHGKQQIYMYKNNVSIVLMPLDVGFTHNKKSIAKSAKIRKKTLDKILYSVINRYSGRNALPNIPVIICFLAQEDAFEEPTSYTLNNIDTPITVNFIPIDQLSQWLEDIDDEDSDTIVIFPELNDKQKEKRENVDFMTTVHTP